MNQNERATQQVEEQYTAENVKKFIVSSLVKYGWLNPSEEALPATSFKSDLGMYNLDIFQVAVDCEREYQIDIRTKDINEYNTIENMARYILQRIKEKSEI